MKDILKLIQERQSARGFFDPKRPITKEDLRQILEVVRWTPTAHNMQNFEFLVVDDRLLVFLGDIETDARALWQQGTDSELLAKATENWARFSAR